MTWHDRDDTATAASGSDRWAEAAEDGRDAPPRPRDAGHREDPAWKPEEFLRKLVEAEIAARDASNARTRLQQESFPVTMTLQEFDVAGSWIPVATFAYLASLEWSGQPRTSA